jgi:hypothetical protein
MFPGGSWLYNGTAYDYELIRLVFDIMQLLAEGNDRNVNQIDVGASTGSFYYYLSLIRE